MIESANKTPAKAGATSPAPAPAPWFSLETLRQEVDRLFDDFGSGWRKTLPSRAFNAEPLFRRAFDWKLPAVDIVEKDSAFEITAEVPGLDAKEIEVTLRNGNLVMKGEKLEEKQDESKGYHLRERHFGSFERVFAIPDSVAPDKIDAHFEKGLLKITLPKTATAQQPAKKITIRAA